MLKNNQIVSVVLAPLACVVMIAGCAADYQPKPRETTYSGLMSSATPDAWRSPGLWDFQVSNDQQEVLGSLVMYMTDKRIDDNSCAGKHWKKAVVVYDDLDLEFDLQKEVAYTISGPWLTINLTSSSCDIGHNFVGEVSENGASGFFNVAHTFGGKNIGTFVASPAREGEATIQ